MLAYGDSAILFVMTVSIYDGNSYVMRPFVEVNPLLDIIDLTDEVLSFDHSHSRLVSLIG